MRLEARDVTYSYEGTRNALEGVSLSLDAGEIICVLGRNGGGKSTLLACLGGALKPSRGVVTIDGADLAGMAPRDRARKIGSVLQSVERGFSFTAFESVLLGRTPHLSVPVGPTGRDYEIAEEALGSVGLSHLADRPITEMSGGEQQLVRIARGLCQRTPILLLDEPGAHLDPANRERILEVIAQLAIRGTGFLFTSHDPNDALGYAHRTIVLRDGAVLAEGAPRDVIEPETIAAAFGVRTRSIGPDEGPALVPLRPPVVAPESIAQPGGFLAGLFDSGATRGNIVLVSGLRQTGKTTWCRALVEHARDAGIAAAGLLAPAVFDGRHKSAIDQLDLRTGEIRRLAERRRAFRGRWAFGNNEPRTAWRFDDGTIAWANSVLLEERERDARPDVLIVDELGPLELIHGEGIATAMTILDERRYRLAVVVVRSSLLARALDRWPWAIPIRTDQRYRTGEIGRSDVVE